MIFTNGIPILNLKKELKWSLTMSVEQHTDGMTTV